jgi:DNA polymerase V
LNHFDILYIPMQYIGVIDCNNFFVSCERLFRPDLRGKPVLVLSSNDGCVVARSQEVKDMGIPMGVPYFQIKDIIKKSDITVFSSHFALYRDLSSRVFTVVKRALPNKQQYSIDEAFFTLEVTTVEAAEIELCRIKRLIEQSVGIPVSIGLAMTKTQAKYANRLAKKAGGVVVLTPDHWSRLAEAVPLGDIWGVGRQMVGRYRMTHLVTASDLVAAPRARIDALFGIAGLRLQAELAGQVVYRVEKSDAIQKSIMSSRSFKTTTTKLSVVQDAVAYHVRHAAEELRQMGLRAGSLTVSIRSSRHGDYMPRGGSIPVLLSEQTADTTVLLKTAMQLVEQLFETAVPYKKAGVLLGQFTPVTVRQSSLFEPSDTKPVTSILMQTVDALNIKFGRDMLQIGRHTATQTWSAGQSELSPAYTTSWSSIPLVKC